VDPLAGEELKDQSDKSAALAPDTGILFFFNGVFLTAENSKLYFYTQLLQC